MISRLFVMQYGCVFSHNISCALQSIVTYKQNNVTRSSSPNRHGEHKEPRNHSVGVQCIRIALLAASDAVQYYIKSHTVYIARMDSFCCIANSTLGFLTLRLIHTLLLCSFSSKIQQQQ